MNGRPRDWIIGILTIGLALVAGWWIARDAQQRRATEAAATADSPSPPPVTRQFDPVNPPTKDTSRPPRRERFTLEDALLGIPNERLVRFGSDADYEAFLRGLAGSNLRLLGRLDQLRAVRIGFDDLDDLYDLLDDDGETYSNFFVAIPQLPDVDAQPGAVGFGANTLAWLGITGSNASWGAGVRIAVLDTGITGHPAFRGAIPQFDLLAEYGNDVPLHGHGTAVTSLIAGDHGASPGIAPAADVFSVRIGDETGASNSFLLAEGIVLAVDEGAEIINISMGSYGDSALVREAVSYAFENGVLIVAAAGNEGLDQPAFPAAYDGVISVGSVDAAGAHLDFSNMGEDLSLSAPGFNVNAAWLDEQFVLFTGTSASAPITTAAIAAAMSELGLSPADAAELVLGSANEAGAPGPDPAYGTGMLDVGRVMNTNTAGIHDAALASNYFVPAGDGETLSHLFVTVQNRGTETLTNVQVDISLPNGTFPRQIGTLRPGEIYTIDRPVVVVPGAESIEFRSAVSLPGNVLDVKPSNDRLATEVVLIAPDPEPEPAPDPDE